MDTSNPVKSVLKANVSVADFCSWVELIGHFREKQRTGVIVALTDFSWKMAFSLQHSLEVGAHSCIPAGRGQG